MSLSVNPPRVLRPTGFPYGESLLRLSADHWIWGSTGFRAFPVLDGPCRRHSAAGCAIQKALMDEERLHNVFQGALVLSHRGGQGLHVLKSGLPVTHCVRKKGCERTLTYSRETHVPV